MDWLKVLKILGPAILAVVPGAAPFIPLIMAGMELAEETGRPGVEKKAIAKEAVKVGAEGVNLIAKKEIVNPTEAVQVADDTIDAVVGSVKLVTKALDKVGQPTPTP